ncbi:hypothetical protein DPMN_006826 [Dreissena polymorpha]|uniref:Uncharacterized protein n=1 Tax=Dreissena polymorpha TaxID=45954 RepID=A0A9D4MVB7_DREPO|nr:hypothetical protein DPMN_006826 [Dreissena polymorpha]
MSVLADRCFDGHEMLTLSCNAQWTEQEQGDYCLSLVLVKLGFMLNRDDTFSLNGIFCKKRLPLNSLKAESVSLISMHGSYRLIGEDPFSF